MTKLVMAVVVTGAMVAMGHVWVMPFGIIAVGSLLGKLLNDGE